MVDLLVLLGKATSDPSVEQLQREFGTGPTQSTVEDRHYFNFREHGLSLATDESLRIDTIFLYAEGRDGYRQYSGQLPHGLRFDFDQQASRSVLGQPGASGGGDEIPVYGVAAPWDTYNHPTHSVHVEFGERGGRISLVTLSTPEATPRRA